MKKIILIMIMSAFCFFAVDMNKIFAISAYDTEVVSDSEFSVSINTLQLSGSYIDGMLQFSTGEIWIYETPDFDLYNIQIVKLYGTLPDIYVNNEADSTLIDFEAGGVIGSVSFVGIQYISAVEYPISVYGYFTESAGFYPSDNVSDIAKYRVYLTFTFVDYCMGSAALIPGHFVDGDLSLKLYDSGFGGAYVSGYNAGVAATEPSAFNAGYNQGFVVGRADGYALGISDGYGHGYDDGVIVGNASGYASGYSDGAGDGYDTGFDDGSADIQADFDAYILTVGDLISDSYDSGYDAGESIGYGEGINANVSADFSFANMMEPFFRAFNVMGVEVLPNVTIGMIAAVPLVLGILTFIVGVATANVQTASLNASTKMKKDVRKASNKNKRA